MALYKFLKSLGNKKAGGTYPLLPSAGKILQYKGYVVPVDADAESTAVKEDVAEKQAKAPRAEKQPKKQKEEKKKRGRKPKK